jgi:enterochelin esterase-like enzyme
LGRLPGGRRPSAHDDRRRLPDDEKDETVRIHEYSPPFDAVRFAAHESFFVEDVRRWVRSRFGVALPAERTAVCGVSASGELSLAMGLRHPDLYGDLTFDGFALD